MSERFEFIELAEFNRLVGHLRQPMTAMLYDELNDELSWLATNDRSAVGLILHDRTDDDYSWVYWRLTAVGYEFVDVGISQPTAGDAVRALRERLEDEHNSAEITGAATD